MPTVSVTESKYDMEPDFGDQVVVNKSSVLAQYFGDVEYEQKLYSPGITTNKIAEETDFIECYNKIKNDRFWLHLLAAVLHLEMDLIGLLEDWKSILLNSMGLTLEGFVVVG